LVRSEHLRDLTIPEGMASRWTKWIIFLRFY